MRYLKKFENYSTYYAYLNGDDIWLPRVSLIINGGDTAAEGSSIYDDDGPTWVDFSRVGTDFIQVANQTMYFNNKVINGIEYKAFLNGDSLCIQSKDVATGAFTNNARIDKNENDEDVIIVEYSDGTSRTYKIP